MEFVLGTFDEVSFCGNEMHSCSFSAFLAPNTVNDIHEPVAPALIFQGVYASRYSGPSSYDRLDKTTWDTTKILVLTYEQSLELRTACLSRPFELRPAWRS
jgi:hypothetical protein